MRPCMQAAFIASLRVAGQARSAILERGPKELGNHPMELNSLLSQLAVDARWSNAELTHTADGAIVQRGSARVLLVTAERVIAEPALVERAMRGDFGLLIVGDAP